MPEEEPKQTVLVVDDHEAVRKQLYWALEENYRVLEAASRSEALSLLDKEQVDVILCDLRLPPVESDITEGLAILESARKLNPLLPVIVITGDEDRETALKVVQRGAYDLFHKPFNVEEVEIIVRRATQHYLLEKDNLNLRDELRRSGGFQGGIVGSSPVLRRIIDQARAVAETSATVLITGESGTGKEMLARFIHNISPRARAPFVACNIAALPESLVESELFGHEKGAFTGASARRMGRFEMANTGTLFLDEIGELSQAMQVKLLRVLQERQFERLGGKDTITVDIRVISATNRDLEQMIETGQFREDLYYRLNIVNLELPPLRERPDDIPILANHFAQKASDKYSRPTPAFSPELLNLLTAYRWPGNIRELENVIERAVVISTSPVLDESVLPDKVRAQAGNNDPAQAQPKVPQLELVDGLLPPELSFETAISNFKRQLVRQALRECNGSRSEAAHRLKISRQYLHRLINELNVEG
ncbi:MAG: sigma-54-dependent Fis family transcriptional regulator [Acidobacteriota bacterium]|nr:MAG: sigma-54-dependent Fis family transcriptional regulator [Acidobacteriota bacterium]